MGVFLLLVVVFIVGGLGFAKYQGNKAMAPVYVEIERLSSDEVIDVGTKASGSIVARLAASGGRLDRALGRPGTRRTADGALEWDVKSNAGVMTFQITEAGDGGRLRVAGFSTAQRLAVRNSSAGGIWGMSSAITDMLVSALGIPRNAGRLIRQRRRVLNALVAADGRARTADR